MNSIYTLVFFLITTQLAAQTDTRLYQIISAVSADRIASDISTLANFGTRHTLNDPKDFTSDSPCAMDNAIGMAGTLKAARVPSKYQFYNSIIYVGLSGEEQGLFGGKGLAAYAKVKGWDIIGILNNDMIGNITGVDGVISNKDFKIFSKPVPPTETDDQLRSSRFFGGVEDNIAYGDVLEHVNFDYVKKLTSVNAISLASLAWAPPGPEEVKIGGIVQPAAELRWSPVEGAEGYKIYGRDTSSPTWDYSRFVGAVTKHTREGIVIDNYFFGLAAVSENGHGSAVVFTREYLEIKQIYHV